MQFFVGGGIPVACALALRTVDGGDDATQEAFQSRKSMGTL